MADVLRCVRRLGIAATAGMVAVLGATGAAAARAQAPPPAWPQLQGNAQHTGFEARETSVTAANAGQLNPAWTANLPGTSYNSEVVVADGVAYVGSGHDVTALNAVSGAQLWRARLSGQVQGTPSVRDGLVLVAVDKSFHRHQKGLVVALNGATGASVWRQPVGGPWAFSLSQDTTITTTAERAYVSLSNGRVDALGLAHGYKIWQSAVLPGCALSQPSVAGGLVVIGGGGGYVSALRAANGTVAWQDRLGGGCGYSAADWLPAISQGTVYAGLLNGVAALDLASGIVSWHNKSVTSVFFPLSVTSDAVIAGPDSGLTALSRSDGSILWQSAHSGQVGVTATFGGLSWGLLPLGESGAEVQAAAYSPSTGDKVFASKTFSDTDAQGIPPVVDAGRVYINVGDQVVCLALPG